MVAPDTIDHMSAFIHIDLKFGKDKQHSPELITQAHVERAALAPAYVVPRAEVEEVFAAMIPQADLSAYSDIEYGFPQPDGIDLPQLYSLVTSLINHFHGAGIETVTYLNASIDGEHVWLHLEEASPSELVHLGLVPDDSKLEIEQSQD